MKKLALIFFLAILFFAACGRSNIERTPLTIPTSNQLNDVLDTAFSRRTAISRTTGAEISSFTAGRERMVDYRPWVAGTVDSRYDMITREEAFLDIEALFTVLATEYSLYLYFGGDDVFLPIKYDLLRYVFARPYLYAGELSEIIYKSLSTAINDIHAIFGGNHFIPKYDFVTVDVAFKRVGSSFYNKENGLRILSLSIPDMPEMEISLNEVLKFSIDESGDTFFYTLVMALQLPENIAAPQYITIVYTDNTTEVLSLDALYRGLYRALEPYVSLQHMYGFPVVTLTVIGSPGAPEGTSGREEALQFLEYTNYLKDYPVVIVDLRGNGGGNDRLLAQWFYNMLGKDPSITGTRLMLIDRFMFNTIDASPEAAAALFAHALLDESHVITYMQEEVMTNDRLMILLVDSYSGSASEAMVSRFLRMENTLVIGQNTLGAFSANSGRANTVLPHSGIPFSFGDVAFVHPPNLFSEGRGFAPDIWVTGCALTATINMLNNHIIRE